MYDPRIFSQRLKHHLNENPGVISHYEARFNNISYINGLKSKWYIEDTIIEHIRQSVKSKSDFARNILDSSQGCSLENINISRTLFDKCHSAYGFYCPVTWKHHTTFAN